MSTSQKVKLVLRSLLIIGVVMVFFGFVSWEKTEAYTNNQPITLEFWHPAIGDASTYLNSLIKQFNQTHPDIHVKGSSVRPQREMRIKFIASARVGEPPDITYVGAPGIREFVDLDLIVPLEPLFPQEFLNQYTESIIRVNSYQDKLYAIPLEGPTWGMFYRKDLFRKAGLDHPPKTWDELRQYAEELTQDTNGDGKIDQWGLAFPAKRWEVYEYWAPFLYQAGGRIASFDATKGNLISRINSPETKRGTKFWYSLIQSKVTPDATTLLGLDWEGAATGLVQGRYAMILDGMWAMMTIEKLAPEKWGSAEMPKGPVRQATLGFAPSLSVVKQSQHKQEAAEFLQWLLTSKRHNKYAEKIRTMSWRKDFTETEYAQNPKVKPFVKMAEYSFAPPKIKNWLGFRDKELAPILQDIMLGKITIDEGLTFLETQLEDYL